jgi:AGZA family xanthine/uracil permease-like MFS transporter
VTSFGVDVNDINEVAYNRVIPGVGLTLLFGNLYYSWQSIRMTKSTGHSYTAQPYGINTPAAFAFVFNIMYPVYFSSVDFSLQGDAFAESASAAFFKSYNVALAANFITGAINIVLSFFGPQILTYVPAAALLIPIAGIGFAFLGVEQILSAVSAPLVGFPCIFLIFMGWYSQARIGWGGIKCPEALQIIIVGTALGWITGLNKGSEVQDAAKLVQWYGPDWSGNDLFSNFSDVSDYLGLVIPIAISATAITLMCLVSAKAAGDPYPIRESMVVDGIGTMAVALFGSFIGTVIYIGHPAHKRSGAKSGYSLGNGLLYLFFAWFGLFAVIRSITNQPTIGPIVLFVGLMINEEALNFIPARHFGAYVIGLFPSVCDWVTNVASRAPIAAADEVTGEAFNVNVPEVPPSYFGVLGLKRGAVLISMLWVAMIVNMIDRKWRLASIWTGIASLFALFGIIHAPEAGFDNFTENTFQECWTDPILGNVLCWDENEQWKYFVAYIILLGMCMLADAAQTFGFGDMLPPIVEESKDVFADWFSFDVPEHVKEVLEGPHVEPHKTVAVVDESKEDVPAQLA